MADPEIIPTITALPVADIRVEGRLRPVSDKGVEALMASIREIGHITDAVQVRKVKGRFMLIDGAHRLEAARQLGWEDLPVKVWRCNDRQARFMEVDGNLAGAELTALDTAVFLAARKRLYEEAHPETKAGVAGAKSRWDATDIVSFASATAEKFGLTDRHVRRFIAAGERLDPRDLAALRGAPRPVTLKDLGEISKIEGTAERYDVVERLSSGSAKSAAEARRQYASRNGAAPAAKDPVQDGLKALKTAWKRAPMSARRQFIEQIGDDLLAMQDGGADV